MRNLINIVLGAVRVTVDGPFPERVVNLCAQNRVEFWAVDWRVEGQVSLTLRGRGLPQLERFAQKVGCQVAVKERSGLPEFLSLFRQRYAFLIGLALALCCVSLLSQFVLEIRITGNETVSQAALLQQLQRFGVHPGAFGPTLDRRQIEQEILSAMPELSWMTINLHGTRAEVQVREVQSPPPRVDEEGYHHVVADADGIITHVEAELGDALVREGDIVGRGEVLISGTVTMEPPLYSDQPERYYYVHARGRVWARTWRTVTAVMPEMAVVKGAAGRERSSWSINFFGKRVEFFGNSSFSASFCDRITSVRQAGSPGGEMLPLWLSREVVREYEPAPQAVDLDGAAQLLEGELARRLQELAGEDGQVLGVEYTARVADGLVRVTATGECLEEIGLDVPAQHRP